MKIRRIITAAAIAAAGTATLFGAIGARDAERIAIDHSGAGNAEFVFSERDRDDGRTIWEVSFYDDEKEYSYDIDEETGDIIKAEWEIERWERSGKDIPEAEALSRVLSDAGVTEDETSYLRIRRDREHGDTIYEIGFSADGVEYEYDIADNGTVISRSVKRTYCPERADAISIEEASRIALDLVDGADEDDLRIREDLDDGRIIYEGSIYLDGYEYEFEIDGRSGRVTDFEREREHWHHR